MARATAELSTGLVCGSLLVASLLSCHGQGGSDDFCSDVPPDVPGFAICGAQDGDRAEGRPGGDLNVARSSATGPSSPSLCLLTHRLRPGLHAMEGALRQVGARGEALDRRP
jgi:hypothetical protein